MPYHINPKTNKVSVCRAAKGKCPFQNSSPHFSTKENGQNYVDYVNELTYDNTAHKFNTDKLSAQEIKAYIDYNNYYISNQETLDKDSLTLALGLSEHKEQAFEENLSSEDKAIIADTKEFVKKGYISKGKYTVYEKTETPKAFLENVEGPVKLVAQYSLYNKFKHQPILNPKDFSKKNMAWINDYKNNPELLEKDFNTIQNNMKRLNKLFNSKGLKYHQIMDKKEQAGRENISFTGNIPKSVEEVKSINENLYKEYNIHLQLEKYNKGNRIDRKEDPNTFPITSSYPTTDCHEIGEPYELNNLTTDKRGKINNLYLYDNKTEQLIKIVEIRDSESKNLVSDNGKSYNIKTVHNLTQSGRYITPTDKPTSYELIITNPTKYSYEYKGENKIYHSYVDSTD